MPIASINPTTGEILKSFLPLTEIELDSKLQLAADTYASFRTTSFGSRAEMMLKAAEIFETEKEKYGHLMTLEMGKPIQSAIDEAAKCATVCRYYAENAERFLADETVNTGGSRTYVRYQPIGPILAVMPWNYPFWQVVG